MSVHAPDPDLDADFTHLVRTHYRFVMRTLARHGVTPSACEDAAQDVFLVVHRRWADLDRQPEKARSWLFGIARRVASTRLRGLRRRAHYYAQLSPPPPPTAPDEALDVHRSHRVLEAAIARLEGERREVFELVDAELSGREIAEQLGIPLNSVYSRLRRARAQVISEARSRLAA